MARNLLSLELNRQGHFVLAASSMDEALRTAEHFDNRIELIIANFDLPERETLIRRILQTHPHVRVLVISAATHALLNDPSKVPDEVRRKIREALRDRRSGEI